MAEAKTAKSLPSFSEVLSTTWNGYTQNQAIIWKIVAPYVGLSALQGLLIALYPSPLIGSIIGIAIMVVAIWLSIVLTRLMHQITMKGKVDAEKAQANIGEVLWPYIAVSIIVGIIVMLGLVAFIIPGIILALMYFGATYSTIIDKKGVSEAMQFSIKITKGRKWELFSLLFILMVVVGLIYLITLGVVGFVLGMIGGLASAEWGAGLAIVGQSVLDGILIPVSNGIGVMIFGHLKKLAK
ncbi:hypothetical protein HOI83_04495 [Candidatus Uhrbacteria bacterium]|jgi:hypothetical protein|nr:hypothetical protein [Candidatus Uhrbacteria bacterium]